MDDRRSQAELDAQMARHRAKNAESRAYELESQVNKVRSDARYEFNKAVIEKRNDAIYYIEEAADRKIHDLQGKIDDARNEKSRWENTARQAEQH